AGADLIALGNHTWARSELGPYLTKSERVIRPANYSRHAPGRGLAVAPARNGSPVAAINVMGSLFLEPAQGPFEVLDDLVEEARRQTPIVFVDFHARSE